nr:TnpV protein [Ligilactobacillus ruminis]
MVIPEEEVHTIGIWGRNHQQYLPIIYSDLVLSGKLYGYLADIDTRSK